MSTMLIQSGTLDDIADAIRSKTGKVASMTPLEMPDEIESISGGGGVTKKKNLIISNDTNASTLLEQVVDENLEVTNVFAGTYNSEANAYQTDLIKYFYDTVGTYGHQYYWHVIAKTNVTCDGTDYVAGDIIDYWYYNVKKTLLVEEV